LGFGDESGNYFTAGHDLALSIGDFAIFGVITVDDVFGDWSDCRDYFVDRPNCSASQSARAIRFIENLKRSGSTRSKVLSEQSLTMALLT
jgi:hypothetical protein